MYTQTVKRSLQRSVRFEYAYSDNAHYETVRRTQLYSLYSESIITQTGAYIMTTFTN
jgi:hypothetical protein